MHDWTQAGNVDTDAGILGLQKQSKLHLSVLQKMCTYYTEDRLLGDEVKQFGPGTWFRFHWPTLLEGFQGKIGQDSLSCKFLSGVCMKVKFQSWEFG